MKKKEKNTHNNGRRTGLRRTVRLVIKLCLALLLIFALLLCICNITVISASEKYVLKADEALGLDADCIIVLGAGLNPDGSPSAVLTDRLDTAYYLYKSGASGRLLVSGDHGDKDYDESNSMKNYLVAKGVDADIVFADHAGFSTYETMYRAREVFGAKKVIVVTQDFHISRAVFIARALGMEAYGVTADRYHYGGIVGYEIRETAARGAYVLKAIFQPEPTYLGPAIPLSGSASVTDG